MMMMMMPIKADKTSLTIHNNTQNSNKWNQISFTQRPLHTDAKWSFLLFLHSLCNAHHHHHQSSQRKMLHWCRSFSKTKEENKNKSKFNLIFAYTIAFFLFFCGYWSSFQINSNSNFVFVCVDFLFIHPSAHPIHQFKIRSENETNKKWQGKESCGAIKQKIVTLLISYIETADILSPWEMVNCDGGGGPWLRCSGGIKLLFCSLHMQ